MASKMPPKTPSPLKTSEKQYRKKTPLDPISANKIWADICNQTERVERKTGPFQLDVRKLIIIPDKPNYTTPDVKVTMKEYEEAIKLLEKVDPIKKREKIPPEKYNLPATVAQDYGWYSKPLIKKHPLFQFPKGMCEITEYADTYYKSQGRNPFQKRDFIVKDHKGKGPTSANPKSPPE